MMVILCDWYKLVFFPQATQYVTIIKLVIKHCTLKTVRNAAHAFLFGLQKRQCVCDYVFGGGLFYGVLLKCSKALTIMGRIH